MAGIVQTINKPSLNIGNYTLFLAGDKKVGKTDFCAGFEDHHIFEMEVGNAKHLECSYTDIPNLKVLNAELKKAEETEWFKTFIVDEVNVIYEMIMQSICDQWKVMDLSALDYGQGWAAAERQFNQYIRRFQALPGGNIYTGHNEIKNYKVRGKKEGIDRLEAKLAKMPAKLMDAISHLWGVMSFEKDGKRVMWLEGDNFMKAGHGFKKEHFKLINDRKIPLGNSGKEAHRNFILAWNNEPIPGVSVSVKQGVKTKPVRQLGVSFK